MAERMEYLILPLYCQVSGRKDSMSFLEKGLIREECGG
jgi:hypothetical protein